MNFAPHHIMESIADAKIAAYEDALRKEPQAPVLMSTVIGLRENSGRTSEENIKALKRAWVERYRLPRMVSTPRSCDPDRPLRIGYVSSDFKHHSAAWQFARVMLKHDRDQFQVYGYQLNPETDALTERLAEGSSGWRACDKMSPIDIAMKVREDAIDILVDLCGHCPGLALPAFTIRPAPIQVAGWGYLAPTYVPEISHVFADEIVIPPSQRDGFAVLDMDCALAFQPPVYASAVREPPRIKNGYPTFGYLGRLSKVSDDCLRLWCTALRTIPDARLLLKDKWIDEPGFADALQLRLREFGMADDAVELRGRTFHVKHLDAHNDVDVCLDSLPTNGGMTTLEALWMGRPVVGLCDKSRLNGRVGLSIARAVGGEPVVSIARGANEFAALCRVVLKMDVPDTRKALLRSCIVQGVAQRAEAHYRQLWRDWCAGRERVAA